VHKFGNHFICKAPITRNKNIRTGVTIIQKVYDYKVVNKSHSRISVH